MKILALVKYNRVARYLHSFEILQFVLRLIQIHIRPSRREVSIVLVPSIKFYAIAPKFCKTMPFD